MPIAITKQLIPATFEEAQEIYELGKDVVISVDGKTGEAVSKKYNNQHMKIDEWTTFMKAQWFIVPFPCQCHKSQNNLYPVVKLNEGMVFEICPDCKGTVKSTFTPSTKEW